MFIVLSTKQWMLVGFCPVPKCLRASPMVLNPHMHLLFFIRDAYADPWMWPSGHLNWKFGWIQKLKPSLHNVNLCRESAIWIRQAFTKIRQAHFPFLGPNFVDANMTGRLTCICFCIPDGAHFPFPDADANGGSHWACSYYSPILPPDFVKGAPLAFIAKTKK
jgi:hypothetical protein